MRPGTKPVVVALEVTNPHQAELMTGLRSALEPLGVPLLLHLWGPRTGGIPGSLRRLLERGGARGLVITTLTDPHSREQLTQVLADSPPAPTLYLGRPADDGTTSSSVRADNAMGMQLIVRHLVREAGVNRLLVVRGLRHHPDSREREEALRRELTEQGVRLPPDMVVDGDFEREASFRVVGEALRRMSGIQAVVAMNDRSALGALDALAAAGLRVPEDVLVTGFDDEGLSGLSRPALTTVSQNLHEQGALAGRLLIELIEGGAPVQARIPVQLVVRASSRRGEAQESPATGHDALRERVVALDTSLAVSRSLMSCTDVPQVIDQLRSFLARLDLRRCFLVLRTAEPRPQGVLALSYHDGRFDDVDAEQPFDLTDLLPGHLAEQLVTGTLSAQPLAVDGDELGYLLIDQAMRPEDFAGDVLRTDLSRALHGIRGTQLLTRHAEELEGLVARRTEELEREVATRRRAEEALSALNTDLRASLHRDGLTGIANRAAFDDALTMHWAGHNRSGQPLSLIMVDVDHFKAFNDRYGHVQGDVALRVVARCLSDALKRQGDLAARYGGEEFALVLPNAAAAGALVVAERIRSALEIAAIEHLGSPSGDRLTVSIGIATMHPTPLGSPDELTAAADLALYEAKRAGRNTLVAANS